jgi:hypothetical protein
MKTYDVQILGMLHCKPLKIEAARLDDTIAGCTRFIDDDAKVVAVITHVPGMVIMESDEKQGWDQFPAGTTITYGGPQA